MHELEGDERFLLNLEDIKDYAVFRVDTEGRIASWNAGAERLKGYTAEEAIGQPFAMLFTEEERRAGLPEQEMRLALEKGVFQGEGIRVRKGGELFHAKVTLRSLSDQEGVHRGYVKVTRDISERKRIEDELHARVEFEQQLIGIVSHDLRTPLTAISLSTSLLLREPDLGTRLMAIIGRIQSSAERAQRMIASLLDFTQARVGGGFVLRYENMDLRELAEHVLEEVRLGHPGRELLFETHGDVQGEWDSDRLAQLITNLVNNALVHGLEDTPVRLNIQGGPGSVVLMVHNEGRPISPDTIPHLFEPMRRGKGTTHSAKAGSIGLGLYIVQQIVRSHGGEVSVDSSEEGGTTFSVVLPRLRLCPEAGARPVLSS